MRSICERLTFCAALTLLLASPLAAQEVYDATGTASLQDFSGSMQLSDDGSTYLLFDKRIGDGVGFRDSYQKLGFRTRIAETSTGHLFGEIQLLISDHARLGANVGGGYRFMKYGRLHGLHAWYDQYETTTGFNARQVAFGYESLGEISDYRVNGYVPVGEDRQFVAVTDLGTDRIFQNQQIAFLGRGLFEETIGGFDAEYGRQVGPYQWMRGYVGGYFYSSPSDDDAYGVSARGEARINEEVTLNYGVTHDGVFDTNFNLGIEIRFNGGLKRGLVPAWDPEYRVYGQVRRKWPVGTRLAENDVRLASINPLTGRPYRVVHVDDSNNRSGDGSFENPFNSLPDRAPGADLVLVQRGNGNTTGNIILGPNQSILGEGKAQFFNDLERGGSFQLPASFASSGPAPVLIADDPNQSVIVIDDNAVVSSFDRIVGGNVAAISGTSINNFLIECIHAEGFRGVEIMGATGQGTIRDSSFDTRNRGIFVVGGPSGSFDLSLTDIMTEGGVTGTEVIAIGNQMDLVVDNLQADNNSGFGLRVEATDGAMLESLISDVNVTSSAGQAGLGLGLFATDGATHEASVTNVTAVGNQNLLSLGAERAELNTNITNGTFNGSTFGNGVNIRLQDGTGSTTFTNLQANNNAFNGVLVDASGDMTDYNIDVIDSTISNNLIDGVQTLLEGGAQVDVFVDPTFITGNGDNAFQFDVIGAGSTLQATFVDTDLSNSGGTGVLGRVLAGGTANLDLLRSPVNNSGEAGLDVTVAGGSNFSADVASGSFTNSGTFGFGVLVEDGSRGSLRVMDTTIIGNEEFGFGFLAGDGVGGPSRLTAVLENVDLSGNVQEGLFGNAAGTNTMARLRLENTTIDNSTTDAGARLIAEDGASIVTVFNRGSISGNALDGVNASAVDIGSSVEVSFNEVPILNNGGDGVDVLINGLNASGRVAFNDSALRNNGGDGFAFNVLGGGQLEILGSGDNDFRNNSQRAFDGRASGAGSNVILDLGGIVANNSGRDGGRLIIEDSATLDGRFSGGSFSNNADDGLEVIVRTNAMAMLDLTNVSFNGNGNDLVNEGHGFNADVTEDATLIATLTGSQARNNFLNGFDINIDTRGTVELPAPTTFSATNNGGAGLNVNVAGGSRFDALIQGGTFSSNGQQMDASGVAVMATGVGTITNIAFDGTNASNNRLNGFEFNSRDGAALTARLNTTMDGGTTTALSNNRSGALLTVVGTGAQGRLIVGGEGQFDNNGLHGIEVLAMNAQQVALLADGSASNNGADGIHVEMDNVNSAAIDTNGVTAMQNGGDGVSITAFDTQFNDLTIGGDFVSALDIDNTIATMNGADGAVITLNGSTIDTLNADSNEFTENGGNGLTINLVDTNVNNLNVTNNQQVTSPNAGLNFFISGNTNNSPFSATNTSDTGVDLLSLTVDLTTAFFPVEFNSVQGQSFPFTPVFPTDIITGLNMVNGQAVPPFPITLVPDGTQIVQLDFTDFNPNETFAWMNDVDFTDFFFFQEQVFGNDLVGTTITADFTGGLQLSGQLQSLGGATGAGFFSAQGGAVTTGGILDNGGDGVQINLTNSTVNNLNIAGNEIDGNGDDGIDIVATAASAVSGTIDGNDVTNNTGEGITLTFNDSSLNDVTVSSNTVVDNGGDGVQVILNNQASFNGLTIVDNADIATNGAHGIDLRLNNSDGDDLLIQNNGFGVVNPPNPTPLYDIDIVFTGGLTPSQQAIFTAAEMRWESIIIADLPDVGAIDDLQITASGVDIDGPGGILGQAGPRGLRAGSFLPFDGIMQFDTADVLALEASGQLLDVILHEMAHVIGFGTIWDDLGLLVGAGSNDPRFAGVQATMEYNARFANADPDVPVANTGGPGTRDSHWRESVYMNELMTGFLNPGVNPLSRSTIAQFADLGYTVDITQADPFLAAPSTAPPVSINDVTNPGDVLRPTEITVDGANNYNSLAAVLGREGTTQLTNIVNNELNGINISLTNADLTNAVINANNISGHDSGTGVQVTGTSTMSNVIDLAITNNDLMGNQQAIDVDLTGYTGPGVTTTGNTVSLNTVGAIRFAGSNLDVDTIRFDNNQIDDNGTGIAVLLQGSTVNSLELEGNQIANTDSTDGVNIQLGGSMVDTVMLQGNRVVGSGDDTVQINLNNSMVSDLLLTGNTLGAAGGGPMGGNGVPVDDSLPVIRAGFDMNNLAANDDGSTAAVDLGFLIDYFGTQYTQTFVNNNGNITFDAPLSTFTPFDLLSTATPIIAPFFADVDTREGPIVTYGQGTVGGRAAFGVNWPGVHHFSATDPQNTDTENIFQLVLIDRSDIAPGDFDFEFNFEQILWEAGTASGSDDAGLGGSSARSGYSNGIDTAFELPGSAVNGAFLDSGPAATSLIQNSIDSMQDGRYIFFARNGGIGANGGGGTGDGFQLNINASTVDNLVVNQNSFENNGDDGIELNVTNDSTLPSMQPIQIVGNTITGQGGDAITLINPDTGGGSILIDILGNSITENMNGTGVNIQTDDQSGGVTANISNNSFENNDNAVNVVVDGSLGASDIGVTGNTILTQGTSGVTVTGNDTLIDEIRIDQNVIRESGTGDGVQINLTNTPTTLISIADNPSIEMNGANGVNINLDTSAVQTLRVVDNFDSQAGNGVIGFSGNTNNLGWFVTNNSDPGNEIVSLEYDITGNADGLTFATTRGFFAQPFDPFDPFAVEVGLVSVNGIPIDPTTNPLEDTSGNVLVGGGIPDGSTLFTLGFNDFEESDFGLSFTLTAGDAANNTIFFGDSFRGRPVTATFSDGRQLTALFSDDMISTFSAMAGFAGDGGISNNVIDGLHIDGFSNVINYIEMNNTIINNGDDNIELNP